MHMEVHTARVQTASRPPPGVWIVRPREGGSPQAGGGHPGAVGAILSRGGNRA
jgi:hypothetical protein